MDNTVILKGSTKESKQLVDRDTLLQNGIIEPFINFDSLLKFYYYNVYHQRSIKLKAALLSQIEETNLDKHLPSTVFAKDLLYAFTLDSEIYGNAFLEKAGTTNDFYLYHMLGYQGRLNVNKELYQINNYSQEVKLEGYHFKYHAPISKYYGEPDYLTTLDQINTNKKADKYNSTFFDNGARPGFAVMFENSSPNKEQIAAFKSFFGANYKGYDNAHKTILFHTGKTKEGESPAKINLEKLDNVSDMSFEKLKKVNRDEIIAAHGVPPRLAGVITAGQLGGGSELIDQLHAFNETVIKPKKTHIESFFENIGISLKLKELDVTNFKDDSELVTNLVDSQILTRQEAKELLGFVSSQKVS